MTVIPKNQSVLEDDLDYMQENMDVTESYENVGSDEADNEISDNSEENELLNAGWVDSISKILKTKKPKGKRTIVLSKAKKLNDIRKEKPEPIGFEVETAGGKIKEEKLDDDEINNSVFNEPRPRRKRDLPPNLRVKPNILEKDRERVLQKIATKGVVQLFNAVKMQQKEIDEKLKKAGPLEGKKEKVLKNLDKRAFLDVLMGETSHKIEDDNIQIHKTEEGKKNSKKDITWSVLKDDFMMTAKMKDWDKELDVTDENSDLN